MKEFIKYFSACVGLFILGALGPSFAGEVLNTYVGVDLGPISTTSTTVTVDGITDTGITVTGGSSQSSYLITLENNATTDLVLFDQYGSLFFLAAGSYFQHNSTFSIRDGGAVGTGMSSYGGSTANAGFNFNSIFAYNATSGKQRVAISTPTFSPTSGTATMAQFEAAPTINQTGGANGITRGFHSNPTLTAADDWRDFEADGGGDFSFYAAGAAPNRLPVQSGATPSAPVTCAAGVVGTMQYVDDNNDSNPARVCICILTDDSTADWVRLDDMTTACFY